MLFISNDLNYCLSVGIPNGQYLGEVKDGKPWGQGYALYNEGHSYKGEFVNGICEGNQILP